MDAGLLPLLLAKHIFLWSRIRCVRKLAAAAASASGAGGGATAAPPKGSASEGSHGKDVPSLLERRQRHLQFPDFLEAFVRVATLVSLPTEDDLKEVGAPNAGIFLLAMQERAPKTFHKFAEDHRPLHEHPDLRNAAAKQMQPPERCVEHLVNLCTTTVRLNCASERAAAVALAEAASPADESTSLDAETVGRFLRQRAKGVPLDRRAAAGAIRGDVDFGEALDAVRERFVLIKAALKIQMLCRRAKARKQVEAKKAARGDKESPS